MNLENLQFQQSFGEKGIIGIKKTFMKDYILDVPIYSSIEVPGGNCSRYARKATLKMFGLQYKESPCDAWDLRYFHKTLPVRNFKSQYIKEEVIPGDIVGFFNPDSDYKNKVDVNGEKAGYTHVAIFLGLDRKGQLRFAEHFHNLTQVPSLHQIRLRKNTPLEIIKPERI